MKAASDTKSDYHEEQTGAVKPKCGDSFKEQISKEKPQEKQDMNEHSGTSSETQLDDIDWDKFFEEHKNNHDKKKEDMQTLHILLFSFEAISILDELPFLNEALGKTPLIYYCILLP